MSSERFERYVLIAQRFGARTVLFQEAAARRLGLTATQLECFIAAGARDRFDAGLAQRGRRKARVARLFEP